MNVAGSHDPASNFIHIHMAFVDFVCVKQTCAFMVLTFNFHDKGVRSWEKNAVGHAGKL